MLHIRLPEKVRQQLKAVAALENKSMTQLLGEIIECFLETKRVNV